MSYWPATKILNILGNLINPATEETVATLATEATVATLATEATLAGIAAQQTNGSQLAQVSGSVTANAGTNLNTSALSTEVTLAAIKVVTDQLDFDTMSGRLSIIDHVHAKVHEGKNFFVQDWQDVTGAATNFDIRIDTPASARMHFTMHFHTEDEFTVTLYEGATLSVGTAKAILNSDRGSAIASGATITYGPTVTATGTQIKAWKSGAGTWNQEESARSSERILKQNTQYLLRFNRVPSGTGYVDFEMDWYEVP